MDEDEGGWRLLAWLLQNLTPEAIVAIVLVVVVVAAVAAIAVGLVALRYRRHPRLRRAISELRAEHAASGAEADLIALRLELREALDAARRAVASLDKDAALGGDLPALLDRLDQTTQRLDRHLGVLEGSVDEWTTPRELAPVRRRVREAVGAARDIQRAALAALAASSAGEVRALTQEIEREVTWVHDGVEAMGELLGPERRRRRRAVK